MMFQKKTLSVALIWLFVAASIMMYTHAASRVPLAAARAPQKENQQIFQSLAGCRCCNFVLVKNFIQCGTVCCVDGCCG